MNRYIIRALVAVLTFCIGVAVAVSFRTSPSKYRYREHRCPKAQYYGAYDTTFSLPPPIMSIENAPTDPLKVRYSFTKVNPANPAKRLVEFAVENNSGRDVASYALSYNSNWYSNRHGGGGGVSVINTDGFVPFVSINCDADQTLTVWVSSVDFKDGSRWTNSLNPGR